MKRNFRIAGLILAMAALGATAGCGKPSSNRKGAKNKASSGVSARPSEKNSGPIEFSIVRETEQVLDGVSLSKRKRKIETSLDQQRVHAVSPIEFQSDFDIESARVAFRSARAGDRLIRVVAQFAQDSSRFEASYDLDRDEFFVPAKKLVESISAQSLVTATSQVIDRRVNARVRAFELVAEFMSGKTESFLFDCEVLFPLKELRVQTIDSMSRASLAQFAAATKSASFVPFVEKLTNDSEQDLELSLTSQSELSLVTVLSRPQFIQRDATNYDEKYSYGFARAHLDLTEVEVRRGPNEPWVSVGAGLAKTFILALRKHESVEIAYRVVSRAGEQCVMPSSETVSLAMANRDTGRLQPIERVVSSSIAGFQIEGAIESKIQMKRLERVGENENAVAKLQRIRSLTKTQVGEGLKGEPLSCQGVY